jgi:hypothetical protein
MAVQLLRAWTNQSVQARQCQRRAQACRINIEGAEHWQVSPPKKRVHCGGTRPIFLAPEHKQRTVSSPNQVPFVPSTASTKRFQVLDNDDRVVLTPIDDPFRR